MTNSAESALKPVYRYSTSWVKNYSSIFELSIAPAQRCHRGCYAVARYGDVAMKWDQLEEESCSVARTLAVIGDRCSLLVLRECFLRIRRFEEFQSRLGITRALLAD